MPRGYRRPGERPAACKSPAARWHGSKPGLFCGQGARSRPHGTVRCGVPDAGRSGGHNLQTLYGRLDQEHRRKIEERFAVAAPNANLKALGGKGCTVESTLAVYGTASAAPRRRRTCTRRAAPGSDGEGSARRSGWFRSIRMEVKPAAPEARVRPDLTLAGADGATAPGRTGSRGARSRTRAGAADERSSSEGRVRSIREEPLGCRRSTAA